MQSGGYDKDAAEAQTHKWNRMLSMNQRLGLTPWTKVGNGVGVRHGSIHYYNLDTGSSVWTDDFHPEWMQVYSRKKIKYCWVNQFTNQVVWRKPKSYKKGLSKSILMRFMEPGELKSALLIQDAFRTRQDRHVALVKEARANAHLNVAGWVTCLWRNPNVKPIKETADNDSDDGQIKNSSQHSKGPEVDDEVEQDQDQDPIEAPYYFHGRTNTFLWIKPIELRDAELKAQGMEAGDRADNVVVGWATCYQKKPNPNKPLIVWDEEVGDEFYYHVRTGELIIGGEKNKPEKLQNAESKPPEWIRLYDPGNKKYYYYNQKTEQTEWRKPMGYKKPPKALLLRGLPMRPELKAALVVQNCWRSRKARISMRRKRAIEHLHDGDNVRLDWVEVWDYGWKCNYWFREGPPEILRWKKPNELIALDMPPWVKLYSPAEIEYYWFNNFTQQVVWEIPDGYVDPPKGSKLHLLMSPEVSAACVIQNAYRARSARRIKYKKLARANAGEAVRGWVKMPRAGTNGYWWSVETDQVVWELPAELGGGGNAGLQQEWCRVYSPPDQKYYYYSNWSHDITWDPPINFIPPPKGVPQKMLVGPYLKAVLTIQGAWRSKIARREKRRKSAQKQSKTAINGWVVMTCRWINKRGRVKKSNYWWSVKNNNVVWELPTELGGGKNKDLAQEWVKIYSPANERFYYYSNWTHDISWVIPDSYKALPTGIAASFFMDADLRATLAIQGAWRRKQARRVLRATKARHMGTLDNARIFRGWVTEWDKTAKADFYFNVDTGEISWKLPTVLMVPKWIKVHDPTSNWHYYVNNDTGEQQTETPSDYHSPRGPHAKLLSHMITNPELRSAMAIQRAFRSRQTRRLAMASQLHKKLLEEAETFELVIEKEGALGFHLSEPERDVGGLGVGKGALQPGAMFQQYAALVNAVNQNGQAELAGAKSGDLLSSVSGVSFIGKKMKDVITFIRKQKRPLTFQFRRRFQIDPEYPRIKYPRLDLVHMGWLEVDTEDVHYGKIRYWWKIDTHHLTIIAPPAFAALEQARKEASMYQPRSLEMKKKFKEIRTLVDNEPRNPLHRMALARLHIEDKNPKGAMKQMERVLKTPKLCDDHGDGPEVWELTGDAYFLWYKEEWKRKDLDIAWRAYQKMAQRMHVPKPHALMNLAKCYEAYGSYDGAALVLGDLISLHKDWDGFDQAVFHAGVLLKHLKQYEDAALYLSYLAAHDAHDVKPSTIWFQIAHCFHLRGEDDHAMEGIKQIFHTHRRELRLRDPPITTPQEYVESSQIWDEQGHELFDKGMYVMAADAFRHALLRAPSPWETYPETWANLAKSLHRTCEREQAESVLLKAIEIHQGNEMLEKLHLKISEEYAAAQMAEQRAALMVQHRFRKKLREKREAKVAAALEDAMFQKAAEMLRHILQSGAVTALRKWNNYTKYVTGIRKFSEHIMGNCMRVCMEAWKAYHAAHMKRKGLLIRNANVIQRCVRAYNVKNIPKFMKKERKRQQKIVVNFVRKMQLLACGKCIVAWHSYMDAMQRARGVYDRIIKRYMRFCFYAWVEYTRALPTLRFFGASQFQKIWRGMCARVELRRLKGLQRKAAELIQARIRARIAMVKAKYKRWKEGIVERKAATKVQSLRRGYLARRWVWLDMVHAAVLFQAVWRSKYYRLRRGRAARRIQVGWAVAYVKRIPLRDEAAIPIQAIFRGHVCRLWLALNRATVSIQRIYRGHAGRQRVEQIRSRLRQFWAHLLFSNENNGLPGDMTSRMIDIGDTEDNQKELNRKNNVPSTEGFLASPKRHQRLVPALWKKYPVQKGSSGVLVGNGKTLAMPVFADKGRKTMKWVQSEKELKSTHVDPLPLFAVKDKALKRVAQKNRKNPPKPRLFADTTISSGWSSLHAIYVMPPADTRDLSRPPSAAVERLVGFGRELEDNESVEFEEASYGGYGGVYASSGISQSNSRVVEWGEASYGEQQQQELQKARRRPGVGSLGIHFPTPNVGLRSRKALLGKALGSDTAKKGSAAHVLVESGDVGLLQSFMKLKVGGRSARSMKKSPKKRRRKKKVKR